MAIYNKLSRMANSIGKRLFWRQHLQQACHDLAVLRRELPSTEMLVTLPLLFRGKGYYRTLELKQNMSELLPLARLVEDQRPATVCEIGTLRGGTLYLWCQLAAADAQVISIDLPGGQFGGGYNERSLPFFQSFRQSGQTLTCLRGDSHSPRIRQQLLQVLEQRPIDFLFIDGDHSYAGVKQDYLDYSPLVRPGGLIAFHDIVRREAQPDLEVWRFWQELREQHPGAVEYIEAGAVRRRIGIGVLRKP